MHKRPRQDALPPANSPISDTRSEDSTGSERQPSGLPTGGGPPARPYFLCAIAASALLTSVGVGLQALGANPAAVAPGGSQASGAAHVAACLADNARQALRRPDLEPVLAARQAAVILAFSSRLDPSSLSTLRLLRQTAAAAGLRDLQRDTLRRIIAADPGDLVAQMHYIDLLAAGGQTIEERSGIYQNAWEQSALDPQIRSQIALRLALLAEERGEIRQARLWIGESLRLNGVNVAALRHQVRLTDDSTPVGRLERLRATVRLLDVNPYQPDAWLDVARACAAANLHDRAADFLGTSGEQLQIAGAGVSGDFYLEYALLQALAGRHVQALQLASDLAALPDAPLEPMLVAQLLARGGGPGIPDSAARLAPEIRKRLAELVREPTATALADAAGVELTILPEISPQVGDWIDEYARRMTTDDPILARLRGWRLYRQGQHEEARVILSAHAGADPLARLGLACIHIDQGRTDAGARELQVLWDTHPSGLLALQVALAARRAGITLADTPWTRQLREAVAPLTPGLARMHRQPQDVQLIIPGFRKPAVGMGEPILLTLRIRNTTDRPQPVGPEGVIKTTLGIAAATRSGTGAAPPASASVLSVNPLGLLTIQDVQRVYRLEPRQIMEVNLRVDQGKLAELFERHPATGYSVGVTAMTVPCALGPAEFTVGLGGQVLAVGEIERAGLPIHVPAEFQRLENELGALTGERRLLRIQVAAAILQELGADPQPAAVAQVPADEARRRLIAAIEPLCASEDPLVRATLARALPARALSAALDRALAAMASDGDPLVRLTVFMRELHGMHGAAEARRSAISALQRHLDAERDPLIRQWLDAALAAAKALEVPAAPATAPATAPEGAPATSAPSAPVEHKN